MHITTRPTDRLQNKLVIHITSIANLSSLIAQFSCRFEKVALHPVELLMLLAWSGG